MYKEPEYFWSEDDGVAKCTIYYKDNKFTGMARCHPCDYDMKNENTGMNIATDRAIIKFYKFVINYELNPAFQALKHYYHTIKNSSKYNKDSYEVFMLLRQMRQKEEEISELRLEISNLKSKIRNYIDDKDKFYKTVRELRKAKNQ